MTQYKGVVVEESLENNLIINSLKILKVKISEKLKWHMYTVEVSEEDINKLSKIIKEKWYMHFWQGNKIIAVFRNKKFEFEHDDKKTWNDVTKYGISLGIPKEQLDFPID